MDRFRGRKRNVAFAAIATPTTAPMAVFTPDPDAEMVYRVTVCTSTGRKQRTRVDGTRLQRGDVGYIAPPVEEAPNPPKYWGGHAKFRPVAWCETAKEVIERTGLRVDLVARCESCQEVLAEQGGELHLPWWFVLARASDHDRTCLNHQVVVYDRGRAFARSPYHPLRSMW